MLLLNLSQEGYRGLEALLLLFEHIHEDHILVVQSPY